MEQALILIVLSPNFKRESIDKLRAIPGVTSAYFLYGPYDLYAMIRVKDREELRAAVMKIRETEGIKSTITCNVIQPL
jgi:DNA-binding Lrp family transcriptional regulator